MRRFLDRETPRIGFIGEERGGSSGADEEWVLDPLDGTSNYVHGLPLYGISLALLRYGKPVIGLVSLPHFGLDYQAEYGRGASCNSEPVRASSVDSIGEAIVSVGDYAVGESAEWKNLDRIAVTAALAARVERIRMVGSAATDLAWVAHGKLDAAVNLSNDAAVNLSNNAWDTAAGTLIAREAGAIVVDRYGMDHSMQSSSTIAVAPQIVVSQLFPLLSNSIQGGGL